MSYEIPQQLEYHERIMFGLTFSQLGYFFLFGGIGLLVFFKLPLTAAVIIDVMLGFVAVLFMFFNAGTIIKNYWGWRKFREAYTDFYIGQYLGFKEIKDNFIIANNKKISVLKVTPVNFSIKSSGVQESIIGIFQKFLNSLEFPIQIVMSTDTIDLADYFKSMSARTIKCYDSLFASHKKFLESVVCDKGILNRSFYIVIPEQNCIDIQIKLCEEKLKNLNLEYKRVGDKELKSVLAKFFFAKGKKILPETLFNEKTCIKINDVYNRIIYAHGYPRVVEAGFLDRIISSLGNFDISIHINPYPIETMLVNLNKELQKQRADLFAQEQKGMINPSLEIKFNDTKRILEDLQKGHHKLFNVSLYINCKAKTLKELDLLTKKVESELNSILVIPRVANYRMAQGLKSTAPLGIDELKMNRNVTTEALSAFFPFTSPFLQVDESGVWLGLNKNNIPIIRDVFKLSNPNGVILAQSGGGKSYFAKLLIARYLLNGVKVMVIDPQGEYADLVKHFGGQRIDLSMHSKTMINPLDLMGHDYTEKRLSLMDLMPVMLGILTEPQKSFLDKAVTEAYNSKDITDDKESWKNTPPLLSYVVQVLQTMEKTAITFERSSIRSLINRLSMYSDGVFSFLNTQTNIDFDNNFVCFDIGGMPKQVKPVIMFLVLDYVYMKMRKSLDRKLLIIDEAWSLLSRTEDASYIFEIVKTCRKYNLGLLLINQEVEGLLASEAGKSVLANSAYTLLMRQKPAVIEQVQETFHLSKPERDYLLTAGIGEGILLVDDEHTEIKVMASEEEHKIITTNADELLAQRNKTRGAKMENETQIIEKNDVPAQPAQINKVEPVQETKPKLEIGKAKTEPKPGIKLVEAKPEITPAPKQETKEETKAKPSKKTKDVYINVLEDKRCYRKSELSPEEIKYRLKNGYHEGEQWDIETGKTETYLLKPRFNESDSHLFLIYRIADFLYKHTNKVWLFETHRPDIIFGASDGKNVAIEIETGQCYVKKYKDLVKKVKELNNEFGTDWFFVITNKEFYWKYKKLGRTYTRNQILGVVKNYLKKAETSSFTPPPEMPKEGLILHKTEVSGGGENSLKSPSRPSQPAGCSGLSTENEGGVE